MEILWCIIIILLIFSCIYMSNEWYKLVNMEQFGGALVQLMAKGPQDSYLTVDTDKYVPEYYLPYGEFLWNNPTRFPYNWYPYYLWPYYWQ